MGGEVQGDWAVRRVKTGVVRMVGNRKNGRQ